MGGWGGRVWLTPDSALGAITDCSGIVPGSAWDHMWLQVLNQDWVKITACIRTRACVYVCVSDHMCLQVLNQGWVVRVCMWGRLGVCMCVVVRVWGGS